MDKYQSWYKGTSKRFAEIMYSIEYTVKYFLQSLNGRSPRKSTFEMLESSLLTIFSSILWSFLKSVSLPFEKLWTMKKIVNSVSTEPQLQIGFTVSSMLCLNSWNWRWLNTRLNLVISFKYLGLGTFSVDKGRTLNDLCMFNLRTVFTGLKGTICGSSYVHQYALLEKRQNFRISYIGISFVHVWH